MRKPLNVHTATPGDLIRLARENGYEILPGRGKGSHVVLGKPGSPTITVPGGKHVGRNVVRRMMKVILAA
jgi:predicted RNA binding protein YcfA (HicA-like mRNA interferase family)